MCRFSAVKAPRRNASPQRTAARWLVAAAPLACLTVLSTAPLYAQSVADAARQERARQQADADRVTHVYTDEDLSKPKILTPDDRARYASALRDWIAPDDGQLADLPMQRGDQPAPSLGEIAWSYRVAKMAQQLDAPDMPRNAALVLPSFLTAMPEPKRPADGRAKRAMQANGRTHVPEGALPMANALAYPAFALTSPAPAAAMRSATSDVTPDSGLDTTMNLGLTPTRHTRRPLSEVRPAEPVRHEHAAAAGTHAAPSVGLDATMNLAINLARHNRRPLSEVRPAEPVLHENAAAANTAHVAPSVGLDATMNLAITLARHNRRPLNEVRPAEPVRHQLEITTTANAAPDSGLNANMDLDLATRHNRRPLSEIHPAIAVRHQSEFSTATVQPGDTLWHIAQQKLGNGYRWKEIVAANPRLNNSTKILAGEQLRLPFPESFSDLRKRTHRVNSGDSLWKLARAAFGNGTAWLCLAKANPEIQNPDLLLPGQKVQIPEHCGVSAEATGNSHVATNLAVK